MSTAENKTLTEMLAEISEQRRKTMATKTAQAFDDRMEFEHRERPGNESIQTKLKAAKAKMTNLGVAGVMIATQFDPQVFNRSVTEGRRFNIYAINKLADLLQGLESGTFRNDVNIAVMKSLFRFKANGMQFNGTAALAAASDKVKVEQGMAKILVRHSVSSATAPTQASSTMNALAAIEAVRNTGTAKHPIWELQDNAVTRRMEEVLAA